MMDPFAFAQDAAWRRQEMVRRAELMRLVEEGRPRRGVRRRVAAMLHALAVWVDQGPLPTESPAELRPDGAGAS